MDQTVWVEWLQSIAQQGPLFVAMLLFIIASARRIIVWGYQLKEAKDQVAELRAENQQLRDIVKANTSMTSSAVDALDRARQETLDRRRR